MFFEFRLWGGTYHPLQIAVKVKVTAVAARPLLYTAANFQLV